MIGPHEALKSHQPVAALCFQISNNDCSLQFHEDLNVILQLFAGVQWLALVKGTMLSDCCGYSLDF